MLDVKLARILIAVAEERSFTRAADRLHIAQPWLSVQVRQYEEQIGFALFARNRHSGITPTVQGEALLPGIGAFLAAHQGVADRVAALTQQANGRLIVGAPEYSADIPERQRLLDAFYAAHPAVQVEIDHGWTNDLIQQLHDGKLDVAFVTGRPDHADLDCITIARFPWLLLQRGAGTAESATPRPLSAYRGTRIGVFRRVLNPILFDDLAAHLEAAGVEPVVPPESSARALLEFTIRTGCPSVATGWQHPQQLDDRTVHLQALRDPQIWFDLCLLRRRNDERLPVRQLWRCATRAEDAP